MSGFKLNSGSIFQMDGRKAKLSQFIVAELFFVDTVDLVLSCGITDTLAFGFDRGDILCQKKHLINFSFSLKVCLIKSICKMFDTGLKVNKSYMYFMQFVKYNVQQLFVNNSLLLTGSRSINA